VAVFKLSEISPWPPALPAKNILGGQTQELNVRRIRRIDRHAAGIHDDITPDSISNTEHCHNWNAYFDSSNASEVYCKADNEPDVHIGSIIEDMESPEKWKACVCATPNVPRLIRPIQTSQETADKPMMKVNAMETKRNKAFRKQLGRLGQYDFTRFIM